MTLFHKLSLIRIQFRSIWITMPSFLFFFTILIFEPGLVFSKNLIENGGFEDNSSVWQTLGTVTFSDSIVHSGNRSFKASSSMDEACYIFQALNFSYSTSEVTFWIYPASRTFQNVVELIANWPAEPEEVEFISRVWIDDDSLHFFVFDSDTSVGNILEHHYWNKISIKTEMKSAQQNLFVNDRYICSLTMSKRIPVEWIIIGDVSYNGFSGTLFYDDISILDSLNTNCEENITQVKQYYLYQNYPNPFNPTTTINFDLPKQCNVILEIFDTQGRRIKALANEEQSAGSHSVIWDTQNDQGLPVANGLYFYRIIAGDYNKVKKMTVLK